jgi:hypothetical protein
MFLMSLKTKTPVSNRSVFNSRKKIHIPSDLVVNHWNSDVESSSHLDFLLLYAIWTLFGLLISYKITSIVSTSYDFTTKSGGV